MEAITNVVREAWENIAVRYAMILTVIGYLPFKMLMMAQAAVGA